MIYLHLGGSQNVGKTEAIGRITDSLILKGFRVDVGIYPPATGPDFLIIVKGRNILGAEVKILINSASDTELFIRRMKELFDANLPIDFVISSIRDKNFYPRNQHIKIMNITSIDTVIEVPLAKITRRFPNYAVAMTWYRDSIDQLVEHVLSLAPFHI